MSDSKPDWDALMPLLYKEFWAENEAIYILAGIKPNESETSFTSLRTGKRVPASEAKYLYKHIFDSWTGDSHPWTEVFYIRLPIRVGMTTTSTTTCTG